MIQAQPKVHLTNQLEVRIVLAHQRLDTRAEESRQRTEQKVGTVLKLLRERE